LEKLKGMKSMKSIEKLPKLNLEQKKISSPLDENFCGSPKLQKVKSMKHITSNNNFLMDNM